MGSVDAANASTAAVATIKIPNMCLIETLLLDASWGSYHAAIRGGLGHLNLVGLPGIDRREVFHVPGVNDLGLRLRRAAEEKRVINASAAESAFRCLLDCLNVFVLIESDNRKAVVHFLNEKKRL